MAAAANGDPRVAMWTAELQTREALGGYLPEDPDKAAYFIFYITERAAYMHKLQEREARKAERGKHFLGRGH